MNDSWAVARLVSQIKENWRRGEPPDADAALAAHPHLRRWKSIVLDLACEEYHLRSDAGQELGADEFCRRFPDYQRSLLHRIEVEHYLRQSEEQHALAWPLPGECFLGYRLIEQLGKGAVGRVFLAEQVAMRDRLVVVKITPSGQREAHTLALLNHPRIVPVYRYDEDPATGLAAICMPYLSRATLEDFLAIALNQLPGARDFPALLAELESRFPAEIRDELPQADERRPWKSYVEGILDLGGQIAEALAHTHRRGVLHLDLKPSNVLLLASGRPMLLDFNLSVDGAIGASVIGGTLPYMSPEQLQEAILGRTYRSRPVDARSDVFSLGVMLFEMLVGKHPFGEIPRFADPREAAKELLRRHEQGPLSAGGADLDQEVIRFLDACLAFHPDQRPGTAAEASAELRRFIGPRFRFRRWRKTHRRAIAAAAGVAAATFVLAVAGAALAPPASERWITDALAMMERQEWKSAEDDLNRSLEADRRSARATDLLGKTQIHLKKYREAFESFEEAYQLSHDPRLLAEMGRCKLLLGEYEIAHRWFEKAISSGYESAEVYARRGDCLARKQRYADAKADFDRAVALEPTSTEFTRARLNNDLTWIIKAPGALSEQVIVEDARDAVALDATNPDLLLMAATACAHLAPSEEATRWVEHYLSQAGLHGLTRNKVRPQVFEPYFHEPWFQERLAQLPR